MRVAFVRSLLSACALFVGIAVASSAHALPATPLAPGVQGCLSGQIKCAIKKKACLLGCFSKAAKGGAATDAACIDKCVAGFAKCYPKVESKGGCLQTGEVNKIEAQIDIFSLQARAAIAPTWPVLAANGPCAAAKLKCAIKLNSGTLNLYAGSAKKGTPIDGTKLAKVQSGYNSCIGKADAKGGCAAAGDGGLFAADDDFLTSLLGNMVNGVPGSMQNQRCQGDTSIECTADVDCGGAAPCSFWFGAPLPLSAGGVSTCVTNEWNGALTGTANADTGASAGNGSVVARVYNGILVAQPCPQCNGDPTQNDGVTGGTCNGGARNGLACDAQGTSPIPSFGTTSLDCPPLGGALIGTLPIDLSNTNAGLKAITLSATSPSCRAAGFGALKCACDVCSGDTTKPCDDNSDCTGFGTCGAPVGQPTKPNDCTDAICTATGGGEGECEAGPFDQHCVIEAFRSCTVDGDCPASGDSCTTTLRECFTDNGEAGKAIVATGSHTEAIGGASIATFAATFCIAPTSSGAVNAVAGLPGPGRLQLTGEGVGNQDGVTACPTQFSFTPTSTDGVLDAGWTGQSHDSTVNSNGKVTVTATCPGTVPNCGLCTYTGPVLNN